MASAPWSLSAASSPRRGHPSSPAVGDLARRGQRSGVASCSFGSSIGSSIGVRGRCKAACPPCPPLLRGPEERMRGGRRWGGVVCMAPEEEKMTRRSPLDFPIEWERPKPGRRPDIFPKFSPMKTPLPPPLPADPPEEDEEEEENKEEEEDPEKKEEEEENPDNPQSRMQHWL
uniref:Uncharacterized protein n=1 Tax=Anthurium amnicola TaxID=1678845 RepID=A0A1D1Y5N1_9ARAE